MKGLEMKMINKISCSRVDGPRELKLSLKE